MVAIALPVLIIMTAFAVDLGSQRALRRQLQADVDVVSLDLVRLADGRTVTEIEADPDYVGYVNQSLTNNGVDPVVTVGELASMVTWGTWEDGADPAFQPSPPDGVPNAVEVVLAGSQDYRFAPGSGDVTRRAVATQDGLAVFSVGSRLASLSTEDSALLNPLLAALFDPPEVLPTGIRAVPFTPGAAAAAVSAAAAVPAQEEAPTGGVAIDALSYQGLANADVVLNDLLGFAFADVAAVNADVASPADVLLTDIALLTLVEASADALAASGAGAEVDAAVDFLLQLALTVDPDLTVNLGQLLGLDLSRPGAVLDARVNLLDLLFAGAQLANETNLLDVGLSLPPGLFDSIPGLAGVVDPDLTLALTVVEAPQIGVGRPGEAWAETSQIDLDLELNVPIVVDLGEYFPLETELATINLALPVNVDVAKAITNLTDMVCAGSSSPVSTLDLPTLTKSAGVQVGGDPIGDEVVDVESPAPVTTEGEIATILIAGRTVARVSAAAAVSVGPDQATAIDDLPLGQTETVDTGQLGLAELLTLDLGVEILPGSLLGFLVGRLINPLTTVVDAVVEQALEPLLKIVDDLVVSRLLRLLGVGVAGADVTAIDATCTSPKLVG